MTPRRRYPGYKNLSELLDEIKAHGYKVIGFRRLNPGETFLGTDSTRGYPWIRVWTSPPWGEYPVIILEKL